MDIRVGNGYDTHPLIKGKTLILGGINIPHDKGIEGHSDGDVLIHSIIDSLLGAMSKRDIGYHFPSNKLELKNISSCLLLRNVVKKLSKEDYRILNIDSTIILEAPPISKFIDSMVEAISNEVGLNKNRISIKATTNEKIN